MLFRHKPRPPHSGIRALFRWIYDTFSSEDRRSVSSNESRPERYRDQNQHADKCAVCECLNVVWQMKHEKYKCVPCDYRRCGNNSQKPALPLDSSAHILRPQWSVVFKYRCDRNDTKQEQQPRRDSPHEQSKIRRQEETDKGETKRNNNRKKGNYLLVFRVAHFAPGCRAGAYARSRYYRCLFKSIKAQGVEGNPGRAAQTPCTQRQGTRLGDTDRFDGFDLSRPSQEGAAPQADTLANNGGFSAPPQGRTPGAGAAATARRQAQ
jgi:hypothetical protein